MSYWNTEQFVKDNKFVKDLRTDGLTMPLYVSHSGVEMKTNENKSDISYLKTSRAFDILTHSGKPNAVG